MKEEYLKRTCIFCGEDSPEKGGLEIIEWCSEHIKKCEHHPMRKLEEKLKIATGALWNIWTFRESPLHNVALLAKNTLNELERMEE